MWRKTPAGNGNVYSVSGDREAQVHLMGVEGRMSVGVKLKCLAKGFGHSLGAREFQKELLP